ncbi:UNVERIFIED_CONTAM: hypothetical protein Sradi_0285600 [Sesamum radiatum]|uniref:Uncharacterized protein n=1 Tax=Sesamum radiatum TaxID=300843 RepID=A0AAW2W1V0_SESRA
MLVLLDVSPATLMWIGSHVEPVWPVVVRGEPPPGAYGHLPGFQNYSSTGYENGGGCIVV